MGSTTCCDTFDRCCRSTRFSFHRFICRWRPKTTGLRIAGIGGFAFFQIIISGILWVWFFIQISVNFPVMQKYIINVIIWASITLSQVVLHVNSPSFPIEGLGDALGGFMLTAVGCFFTYLESCYSKTRDYHVQEHHVHTDVRVMEEAMAEHSLLSVSGCLGGLFL